MKRIKLEIDILGFRTEVAQVRPDITIDRLIQEILVEFGLEYPFLNQHQPQNYVLRTSVTGIDLPADQLVQQVGKRGLLFFRERAMVVPETALALPHPLYLRYRSHIFKIGWTPALIGRPMPGGTDNSLLAVDLEPFSTAVSRRHAEIRWQDDRFAIRPLSDNPVLLNGVTLPPDNVAAHSLQAGDRLLLQRSGIELVCLQPERIEAEYSAANGGVS